MHRNDRGTQISWRRLLPFTDVSPATQRLLNHALGHARHGWVIPIVVPPADRAELRSFFLRTVEAEMRSTSVHIVRDRWPGTMDLQDDDGTSYLFLLGERLPRTVQWAVLDHRLDLPVVMLALETADPLDPAATPWTKAFLEACAPAPLVWPAWISRDEAERRELVGHIRDRLSMPGRRPVPDFDPLVVDYLVRTDFAGTLAVEQAVKAALQRYIQRGTAGPLTVKHLKAFDRLDLIGSHTCVPPLSVVR